MKLSLKNIGKIEHAVIELNGITVIGGENDTGKSTVGKALFSIFDCFYQLRQKIYEERVSSIENILQLVDRNIMIGRLNREDIIDFSKNLLQKSEQYLSDRESLKNEIISKFKLNLEKEIVLFKEIDVDDIVEKIETVFKISDEMIFHSIVDKKINTEFDNQVLNINLKSEGSISLEIKKELFEISISENSISINGIDNSLNTEAVYIDDPFVLDDVNNKNFIRRYGNHRFQLMKKFLSTKESENVIEDMVMENKMNRVYEKLSAIDIGQITRQKNGKFVYQSKHSDKALNFENISTGLKTFIILKSLLMNGSLEANGTIILDEPEIHLHPDWQLLFAEIIVLLQKEFHMNILLNTHSPYFLRAIQVYSAKYGITDVCKYYLSEINSNGNAMFTDVTNYVDKIFAKLSKPLQRLEDEEWNIDEL